MSAAAAEGAPPKKGNKKLIVIGAVVVLVLALGGVGAMLLLKKPHPADGEEGDGHAPAKKAAASQRDPKAMPVFVPLESFTVNLADREAERYAQVGITLEVEDAKVGDQVKVFMPAIRNNILMALAEKSAADLMDREGKTKLAEKIRRETSRALGYEVDDADEEAATDEPPKKKPKKRKAEVELPITAVHFSNFIIQ